ncbi:recombinase family protein [Collimonas silvisoli]|uniref:recombinase family protein n=1 Tax=Collimonas silvisoli TaxID=2825884 RepID=UPI001B8CB724|nr:recombinase family protein [Collimonas silvisoli]
MKKRIGYALICIDDQNLSLQKDALAKAGCLDVYQEKESGKASRPIFDYCRCTLSAGDTLVVWRLNCLGKSLSDLVQILGELGRKGIYFESIAEKVKIGSAAGKLVTHVFTALTEFERDSVCEGDKMEAEVLRASGRKKGRRPSLNARQILEIKVLLRDPDIRVVDIAKRYGVTRATIYKYAGPSSAE